MYGYFSHTKNSCGAEVKGAVSKLDGTRKREHGK